MRALPPLAVVALSLLAVPAGAQDDGCTSRAPCAFVVELTPDGFWFIQDVACDHGNGTLECEQAGQRVTRLDVALGDWYTLHVELNDFYNETTPTHTVSLDGHENAQATVRNDDIGRSQAFQFDRLGTFKLREQPSGDTFDIRVVEDIDDGAGGDGADADAEGSPGLGLVALLAAVAAVAAARRRLT